MRPCFALCVLVCTQATVFGKDVHTTQLNEWPMLMVHNAATTYLRGGILHPINNWAKTQPDGGISGLLDCGARAIDWRPIVVDGTLKMHHGSVTVDHTMSDALTELVAWAGQKGSATEDIIVLGITDCEGTNCTALAQDELTAHGIRFVTDCSTLRLTVADAFNQFALSTGGAVVAIFDCWAENYHEEVACSGYLSELQGTHGAAVVPQPAIASSTGGLNESAGFYTCYADSSSKAMPIARMLAYLQAVANAGPPLDGRLYALQALWQQSTASTAIGELEGSSLLLDEVKSQLHVLVEQWITSKQLNTSAINMLEVNNICDGGLDLLKLLRAF